MLLLLYAKCRAIKSADESSTRQTISGRICCGLLLCLFVFHSEQTKKLWIVFFLGGVSCTKNTQLLFARWRGFLVWFEELANRNMQFRMRWLKCTLRARGGEGAIQLQPHTTIRRRHVRWTGWNLWSCLGRCLEMFYTIQTTRTTQMMMIDGRRSKRKLEEMKSRSACLVPVLCWVCLYECVCEYISRMHTLI